MKSEAATDTLAIPPDLLPQIHAVAEEEHRSAGDVLREVLERGLAERRWQAHAETERQRARELGIADDEDNQPMTDEYRRSFHGKIMQGLQSLREGKGTDGEAFMAEMQADARILHSSRDLAALFRQQPPLP